MAVSGEQSKACCSMPPVSADYKPTGTYETVTDLKTYTVGPADAKQAIIVIYDVFGLAAPQALQGADLLASQGFRVYIPDILKGDYATGAMFAGTPEANKQKEAWFGKFPGGMQTQDKPIADLVTELNKKHEGVGIVGFCWGWKCVVLSEGAKHVKAVAGCHPSFAADDDADRLSVPVLLLPSQNEDMKVAIYDAVEKKNPGKNELEQFKDNHHGFMAARAQLGNEKEATAFREGYSRVADFFKQHL